MLELRDLSRRYGQTVALDGLSLEVPDGDVVGFVGPNGAGKTTAMRIALGVLAAIPPRPLLAGKILGIGLVGLLQLALTAVAGLAAASLSGAIELDA